MKEKITIGIIGLGQRGKSLLCNSMNFDEVEIIAICDILDERFEQAEKCITEKGREIPFETKDYKEVVNLKPDAIIISVGWALHLEVALYAMERDVTVAMEVGGMHSIEECWQLVDCYEKTKTPFMFLENCCYNKDEILATSLVRNGLLGEISYCSGAYCHDLRNEIAGAIDTHHYRLEEYKNHNCDNYPTHELGPIAKILNINRGNRFVRLVSMSSKAVGMTNYINKTDAYKERLKGTSFKQGDVTTTMIYCENGEMITLKLDTTLPHLYDRALTVCGTEGWYNQTYQMVVLDNGEMNHEASLSEGEFFKNQEKYNDYLSDDWRVISQEQIDAGHGGMDYVMLSHFFKAVKNGDKEMPIDVYDAVAWMCITALSEESIVKGNVPVEIPDFTKGNYKVRPQKDVVVIPQVQK